LIAARPEIRASMSSSTSMLPPKAVTATPGNWDNPRSIPRMAPTAEPPEMPRIYGSARGLRSRA